MSFPSLELKNVKKTFSRSGVKVCAVDGVSLRIERGEILGLLGESGSGKSTIARLLLRLINADEGEVLFEGENITHHNEKHLKRFRRSAQMVFQDPFSSFNPKVKMGAALREVCAFYDFTNAEADDKVNNLLLETGLNNDVLLRYPYELSGGQLQRLASVRALLSSPKVLIADEPVSALDVSVQAQLLNLFDDLRARFSIAILFISHDISVIEHLCDRALVMQNGRIVEEGALPALFQNPREDYTKTLIESAPRMSAA